MSLPSETLAAAAGAARPQTYVRREIGPDELAALLARDAPLVMGVLNVTPDSFSDGGNFLAAEAAQAQAAKMVAEGAHILDVGGESSRPGHTRIEVDEELSRVMPILPDVVATGVPVSIDTQRAAVAEKALDAGAAIVNDVWGLQRDPGLAALVAERGVPVVIMHNRDAADPTIDIMADVLAFFERSLDIAARAGIRSAQIVLDPGIGFGKTPEQSMRVLAHTDALHRFGLPLLVGASRKRFIASVMPSEPHERLGGSLAAHLLAAQQGAAIIRAHDVAPTLQALRVFRRIEGLR